MGKGDYAVIILLAIALGVALYLRLASGVGAVIPGRL
jgi:hypothetical protein